MHVHSQELTIKYTNWKGITRTRRILPLYFWYGKTSFHPKSQWLIGAVDLEEEGYKVKDFALSGIVDIYDGNFMPSLTRRR